MKEETIDLLKKFEQEHEVYVSADDTKFYWVVTARIPKKLEIFHYIRQGKTYVSGQTQGNVLVFSDPDLPEDYTLESWGRLNSSEEFVDKALEKIPADRDEYDKGRTEGCGTPCA